MNIFIHLGVNKTASTLIQRSLQISKTKKNGVYPIVRDLHPILGNTLRLVVKGKLSTLKIKETVDTILKDAQKKEAKKVII